MGDWLLLPAAKSSSLFIDRQIEQEYTELNKYFLLYNDLNLLYHIVLTLPSRFLSSKKEL